MDIDDRSMDFATLRVRTEGAVLFAEIAAPPMNLLGPEWVRDLVSLIQRGEADPAIVTIAQIEGRVRGAGRILVDRDPLSAAKQAYDDFEQGRLVGRAVLMPEALEGAAAQWPRRASQQ